jgi:hypothetical protein
MTIESATYIRRLMRAGLLFLLVMLSLRSAATAQKELVTTGSVIPLQHPSFCQIFQAHMAPNGAILFLDVCGGAGQFGSIYQLNPGSTTFQTVAATIDTSGTFWNEGMAMDAKGTIYVTDRFSGTQHIYRTPFNPNDGTWDFSASGDSWPASVGEGNVDSGFENLGTQTDVFLDSPAKDGSGILFVSEQNANNIIMIPVNADGTIPLFTSGPNAGNPQFQYLLKGLTGQVFQMAVDTNGNLYFIEEPGVVPAQRATGVFFVPSSAYTACMAASASGSGTPTTACISGNETSLSRIDPGNPEKFNGLTLDAAGNVYVSDTSDDDGGTRNGLLMIPNESGSPTGVTAASFNFNDVEYLSPVGNTANPFIDPRGFIWLMTGTSGNWSPNGEGQVPGTGNFVLYQLGATNLGTTPIGTPAATAGSVYYAFSGSVTPGSIAFSQEGGGATADVSATQTDPYPPAAGTTPAVPCTAGPSATSTTPTMYNAFSSCTLWVQFSPQGANSVGQVSGQVSMLDSNGKVIPGSTNYLSGIGQGPAVSLLSPSQQTPLATALMKPEQVAGDSLGNSYVADSGLGKVLMFAPGSTAAAGVPIGTGLKAPTGVAVDGAGDVYIADSGSVIEVPAVNGVLNPAGQTTLQSGFGGNLNLAVDNAQNVYVADPSNGRVVRIYNPQLSMVIQNVDTIGSFKKPTAVATDDAGNVYVADGTNLDEVNFWNGQTTITSSLSAPVTGLAVDPSESVDVAQNGGIIRIPLVSGALNFNDAVTVDSNGITAPNSVGIDGLGNLYATASSYTVASISSTGPTTTSVSTPNVFLLSAFLNFGDVSTLTQSLPTDAFVFNIGNASTLALTSGTPTFSGTNASDYGEEADGANPCDTTGATPIISGGSCTLGITSTTANVGVSQAMMNVATNAVNMPSASALLESYSLNNLCNTLNSIALNPATGVVYPGSTMVTATLSLMNASSANCIAAGTATPTGTMKLTLTPQAAGGAQVVLTAPVSNNQATFNATGLNGGTYTVFATYLGDSVFGGSSSSRSFTFTVAQATPSVALSNPVGVTPVDGTYFVLVGSNTALTATVTSMVGSPSGRVMFLNGSTPADATQNSVALSGAGSATFTTTNLEAGTYNLTAVYSGDANFTTVTSAVVTIVVIPPSALITASPSSLSGAAGSALTSTLTITALEGYSPKMGVQLNCVPATLPQFAECNFTTPTVDLFDHNGIPQTSLVTITSNLPVNETSTAALHMERSPFAFAGLFGLGLLGLAFRQRSRFKRSALSVLCLMLVFAGAAMGLSGCTNSGFTHTPMVPKVTTPAGTYNVVITGTDVGTNQITTLPFTLTYTVQ